MLCTRPDVCFVVDLVRHFQSNPVFPKWQAIKRVKHYLCGTADLVLCYQRETLSQEDT